MSEAKERMSEYKVRILNVQGGQATFMFDQNHEQNRLPIDRNQITEIVDDFIEAAHDEEARTITISGGIITAIRKLRD